MIKCILLLPWILFFYFMAWFYTSLRTESVLITTGKNLNKILFFINPFQGISITSIIIGLFAHFSLLIFIVLLFFDNIVQLYLELASWLWKVLGFSLLGVGELIETYIKLKKAKTRKKRKELLGLIIILSCSVGVLFYYIVKYGLILSRVLFG